ncbi:outer membrane beta-barrel protein [Chitinophaga ginsengisoli]|uniref:Outer membrane protein with beta-barrel domain n=1 Tax=Chitinophaga ginsengisoli TaxID=363837 RepID=A0A2P8GDF1_9BACT|nr:outer membrane beta-barrel protein [Chitinophaga ginsengisoli]PSL31980.1 outer membrane protein with beta-barrel domain [Chitinophaga ginsengisoli]
MQLLDDDMDELFRNAASDYPLNTGGGDWEAMRNRLQQAENTQQGTATGERKGRWWFRYGLFGIMTAMLMITAVKGLYNGERLLSGDGGKALFHPDQQQMPVDSYTDSVQIVQEENHNETQKDQHSKEAINGSQLTVNKVGTGSNHQGTYEHVVRNDRQEVTVKTAQHSHNRLTTENSEQYAVNRNTGNNTVRASVTQDIPTSSYPAARRGITAVNSTSLSLDGIHGAANREMHADMHILHANNRIRIPAFAKSDSNAAVQAPKVKQEPASLKKGLYYGLIASPDITTVKFQRTSNVGYNVGLIAGYRFSKRLAVETGVIYERKYYYSDGKYFETKKTPWPTDMNLINVNGWCNMYEIPLNVRYTFATGTKSNWYVNGGMSSYIMKKQGYNYSYEYYGTYGDRDWVYKKATKDWFANVHLGVGYERPLGILGTLRVEPYAMIPVKGIGVGKLPVTSVGMNIGLTRPLRLK